MSFIFAVESFKFYKLKQQNVLRGLFLLAFLLNVAGLVFPIGDSNMLPVLEKIQSGLSKSDVTEVMAGFALINRGHYLFFGTQLLITCLNLLLSYFYANAYLAERANAKASDGVVKLLKALPKLLLMGLVLLLPILFSSLLFFIPLFIMAVMFVFAPVFASMDGHGAIESLEDSRKLSRGKRLAIAITFAVQLLVFNLPVSFILSAVPTGTNLSLVIQAFADGFFILMRGRLIAIFYYFFRVQLVQHKSEDFLELDLQAILKDADSQDSQDSQK